MTGFDDRAPYSLVYIDGWDHDLCEPLGGGRCVGGYDTQFGALAAYEAFSGCAELLWGPGHLAVLDRDGGLAFGPTLPPEPACRRCLLCGGSGVSARRTAAATA